jgi:hypothetical protein
VNLTWSTETPTEPGFYWHRYPGKRGDVFKVERDHGCLIVLPYGYDTREWEGSEWAGPIPEPGEPPQ